MRTKIPEENDCLKTLQHKARQEGLKEGHHELQHSEFPCVPVGGQGHALRGWTLWQVVLSTPRASRVPCSAAAQVGLSPPKQAQSSPPTFPGGPISLPLTSMPKDFSSRNPTPLPPGCPPPFPIPLTACPGKRDISKGISI